MESKRETNKKPRKKELESRKETNKKRQLGTRNVAAKEMIGITRRALLIKQVSY